MTVLDESTLASADEQAEALFKEAQRRRRRRWQLVIMVIVGCALAVAGVLYWVAGDHGNGQSGGPGASSERLPRVPTGPTFNQPSDLPSSWVKSVYRADGLLVTLTHPLSWSQRLPGRGFHYYDIWSFVANFPLNPQWCTVNNGAAGSGVACIWKEVGTFQKDSVLMTLGPVDTAPVLLRRDLVLVNRSRSTVGRLDWSQTTRTAKTVWGLGPRAFVASRSQTARARACSTCPSASPDQRTGFFRTRPGWSWLLSTCGLTQKPWVWRMGSGP